MANNLLIRCVCPHTSSRLHCLISAQFQVELCTFKILNWLQEQYTKIIPQEATRAWHSCQMFAAIGKYIGSIVRMRYVQSVSIWSIAIIANVLLVRSKRGVNIQMGKSFIIDPVCLMFFLCV